MFGLKNFFTIIILVISISVLRAQDGATDLHLKQLIEKKSEYNRLSGGEMDGYRIKIHFGVDRDAAKTIHSKFSARFNEYDVHEEYQQPNFVILVGDFRTKLEAFQALKKIQPEFPNAFIVKEKIKFR